MVFMGRGGASGGSGGNIASGTYVGTGTYGAENPTVIHVPFIPRLILVYDVDGITNVGIFPLYIIPENLVAIFQRLSGTTVERRVMNIEIQNFDVKFYSEAVALYQANENGVEYFWIAFG